MTKKYLSVVIETQTVKVIEKSRFITTSRRVESEAEAKEFIAEISKKYADATHNCYAYICDKAGNFQRFSDDGEPQGTAGMPILEVIKSRSLRETAVVVTRYFGGIKLGAGGLVRAYSGCAAENLEAAEKVIFENCTEFKIAVDYPLSDGANRFFENVGATVLNTEYLNEVIFVVAVRSSDKEKFVSAFTNRFNGKTDLKEIGERYYPVKN